MRKQQLLLDRESANCKLNVRSNSNNLPHNYEAAHRVTALMSAGAHRKPAGTFEHATRRESTFFSYSAKFLRSGFFKVKWTDADSSSIEKPFTS